MQDHHGEGLQRHDVQRRRQAQLPHLQTQLPQLPARNTVYPLVWPGPYIRILIGTLGAGSIDSQNRRFFPCHFWTKSLDFHLFIFEQKVWTSIYFSRNINFAGPDNFTQNPDPGFLIILILLTYNLISKISEFLLLFYFNPFKVDTSFYLIILFMNKMNRILPYYTI